MKEKQEKAVALRYREGTDAAPVIIAKGRGHVAEKIIALARKHGVPVHGDRHLIEILSTLDMYEEIPQELYKAVAEMLVLIYQLSGRLDEKTVNS